jgi:1-aminocyclopropane-1-carboxylate deaminase/D-cysteine desulfhydrase-like pyridoxal-dependent ACC family enzyme
MNIVNIPRIRLAHLPTPLDNQPTLTNLLGGPRILVKRDDMTGIALGGNKARKAEFLIGAARAEGATVMMTTAGVNSNYLRIMAAAARMAGIRPILFMRGTGQEPVQGNLLLNEIVEAEMVFIQVTDPWSPEACLIMEEYAKELKKQGEQSYIISVQTTHAPLASLGYVIAAFELHQQLLDRDIDANYIFTPVGSGVTQAGLVLGAKLLNWRLKVVGMAGTPGTAPDHRSRIADIVERAAGLLNQDVHINPEEIIVDDAYAGESYGKPTLDVIESILLVGKTEGLILDPVYSGKNMTGMIDWIKKGRLTAKDTAIFLHTGGTPALFNQAESLAKSIRQFRANKK